MVSAVHSDAGSGKHSALYDAYLAGRNDVPMTAPIPISSRSTTDLNVGGGGGAGAPLAASSTSYGTQQAPLATSSYGTQQAPLATSSYGTQQAPLFDASAATNHDLTPAQQFAATLGGSGVASFEELGDDDPLPTYQALPSDAQGSQYY